jgi:hypothetical protein
VKRRPQRAGTGIRLLADIRDVFDAETHISTTELLRRLTANAEAPWADWYGKPLTAKQLGTLLDPYRIGPTRRRLDGDRQRGYFAADFTDAWTRYVLDANTPGTSGTRGTGHPADVLPGPGVPLVPHRSAPTGDDLVPEAMRIFGDDLGGAA